MENYTIIKILGKGSEGQVLLAEDKKTFELVAIKRMEWNAIKEANQHLNEGNKLKNLKHPNIIEFRKAFLQKYSESAQFVCLVVEYCSAGDLQMLIDSHYENGTRLREETILMFMVEICEGLSYLHEMNIIHRDLKPKNILITERGHMKIGDLGIAKELGNSSLAKTACGSPNYMSWEILNNQPYDESTDIYSLGMILLQLLTGKACMLSIELSNDPKFFETTGQRLSKVYHPEFFLLVERMTAVKSSTRPTAKDCLSELKKIQKKIFQSTRNSVDKLCLTFFLDLDEVLQYRVLSFLELPDFLNCMLVSKKMHGKVSNDKFWEYLTIHTKYGKQVVVSTSSALLTSKSIIIPVASASTNNNNNNNNNSRSSSNNNNNNNSNVSNHTSIVVNNSATTNLNNNNNNVSTPTKYIPVIDNNSNNNSNSPLVPTAVPSFKQRQRSGSQPSNPLTHNYSAQQNNNSGIMARNNAFNTTEGISGSLSSSSAMSSTVNLTKLLQQQQQQSQQPPEQVPEIVTISAKAFSTTAVATKTSIVTNSPSLLPLNNEIGDISNNNNNNGITFMKRFKIYHEQQMVHKQRKRLRSKLQKNIVLEIPPSMLDSLEVVNLLKSYMMTFCLSIIKYLYPSSSLIQSKIPTTNKSQTNLSPSTLATTTTTAATLPEGKESFLQLEKDIQGLMISLLKYGSKFGRVYVNILQDNDGRHPRGVAIWQHPYTTTSFDLMKLIRCGLLYHVSLVKCVQLKKFLDIYEAEHKSCIDARKEPHWILYLLAVEKEAQKKNIASELMFGMLKIADAANLPIYTTLFQPTDEKMKFFVKIDFKVVKKVTLKGFPEFWCLLRRTPTPNN